VEEYWLAGPHRSVPTGDTAPASAPLSSICISMISPGYWTATIRLQTWTQDSRRGAKRLSRQATQQKQRSLYCEARSFFEYPPTVSQPRSRAKQTRPTLGKGPTVHFTTQFSAKRDWSRAGSTRDMHNSTWPSAQQPFSQKL
jgi:hypothetical protein